MAGLGILGKQAIDGRMAELVAAIRRSVVVVASPEGHGAGVAWGREGQIVTNCHVVGRHRELRLDLPDGRHLAAVVAARDPENDLAFLTCGRHGLPPAAVGDAGALRIGEIILAVGHPRGVRDTATLGIVSGRGRGTWMGKTARDVLQADIVLAPGNSGGPLINTQGEVVGIASLVLAPGIAVAVPSSVVQRFVDAVSRPLRMAA